MPWARSTRRVAPCPYAPRLRRFDAIGEFWAPHQVGTFTDYLIKLKEDRTLRAVLVGLFQESDSITSVTAAATRPCPQH